MAEGRWIWPAHRSNSRSGPGDIIHIDLAFPPDGDSSISDMQLLVETKERF